MMISNSMRGWLKMKERVSWIAAGLLTLCITANDVIAAKIEEIRPSDMDLIEFLGGWETEDGEWVDPALLDVVFTEDIVERKENEELGTTDSILPKNQKKPPFSKGNQDLKDERK